MKYRKEIESNFYGVILARVYKYNWYTSRRIDIKCFDDAEYTKEERYIQAHKWADDIISAAIKYETK